MSCYICKAEVKTPKCLTCNKFICDKIGCQENNTCHSCLDISIEEIDESQPIKELKKIRKVRFQEDIAKRRFFSQENLDKFINMVLKSRVIRFLYTVILFLMTLVVIGNMISTQIRYAYLFSKYHELQYDYMECMNITNKNWANIIYNK